MLTIYVPDDIVLSRIDKPFVRKVIQDAIGESVKISMRVGEPPMSKKLQEKNLRDLVDRAQNYENIQVIGTLPADGSSPAD